MSLQGDLGLLPCCSGSASRVSGLSLVSPSPQLPRGLAQPFPGWGNGCFAGSGDAGGSAAAGCHCRRAGPCAGQGGTGSCASFGQSRGKENLPDARGHAEWILSFFNHFQSLRKPRSLISLSEPEARLISAAFSHRSRERAEDSLLQLEAEN